MNTVKQIPSVYIVVGIFKLAFFFRELLLFEMLCSNFSKDFVSLLICQEWLSVGIISPCPIITVLSLEPCSSNVGETEQSFVLVFYCNIAN